MKTTLELKLFILAFPLLFAISQVEDIVLKYGLSIIPAFLMGFYGMALIYKFKKYGKYLFEM